MLIKNLLTKVVSNQLRHVLKCQVSSTRHYTSDSPEIEIIKNKDSYKKDYVILKLDRAPVNSLNLDAVKDLGYQLDIFEQDPAIKGVIIASELPHVFSAGLDIMELYQTDRERLTNLWIGVQNLFEKLYGSQKVYISAINGHNRALGCLISMACDYRIMAEEKQFKIGLTANLLGIKPPDFIIDTMVNTIGHRQAELALQLGSIYTPQQALQIKLVDQIVAQKDVLETAEKQMDLWCKIPSEARGITKKSLRRPLLDRFALNRDNDLKEFVNQITSDHVQHSIKEYLKQLKEKKSYL